MSFKLVKDSVMTLINRAIEQSEMGRVGEIKMELENDMGKEVEITVLVTIQEVDPEKAKG